MFWLVMIIAVLILIGYDYNCVSNSHRYTVIPPGWFGLQLSMFVHCYKQSIRNTEG